MTAEPDVTRPQPGDYPCSTGKRQYATKDDTKRHRSRVNGHNIRTGQQQARAYRCDRRGFWHVGRRRG